jgi:hypothetical protein
MRTKLLLLVSVVLLAIGAEANADCWYCQSRGGLGAGGRWCAPVLADGETGWTECDDLNLWTWTCETSGTACMNVVVIDPGGSGGGTGGGPGGGSSCTVIGAGFCPTSCFSCNYQLV